MISGKPGSKFPNSPLPNDRSLKGFLTMAQESSHLYGPMLPLKWDIFLLSGMKSRLMEFIPIETFSCNFIFILALNLIIISGVLVLEGSRPAAQGKKRIGENKLFTFSVFDKAI